MIKSAHSSVLQKQASSPSSKVGILKQPTCPKVGGEQARLSNKYINKRRIFVILSLTAIFSADKARRASHLCQIIVIPSVALDARSEGISDVVGEIVCQIVCQIVCRTEEVAIIGRAGEKGRFSSTGGQRVTDTGLGIATKT